MAKMDRAACIRGETGLVSIGFLVLLAIVCGVLAYGYWFGATHGSLSVSADDVSDREHTRPVAPVEIELLNAAREVLATAKGSAPDGAIYITSPETYACHQFEGPATISEQARDGWQVCFERQSRWLMTWVNDVRSAALKTDGCRVENLPVSVSVYPDTWWLWWVPLPHIGGKPYTSVSMRIALDRRSSCPS